MMSTPENNLRKAKKAPLMTRSRIPPYKQNPVSEDELLSQILNEDTAKPDTNQVMAKGKLLTDKALLSSMMKRLAAVEKKLLESEAVIKTKEKRIRVLEEKCEIYRKAQDYFYENVVISESIIIPKVSSQLKIPFCVPGYGCDQVTEVEKKCHKLQKQIHGMEEFLEDYGMIWIGNKDSSDEEDNHDDADDEEPAQKEETTVVPDGAMWSPGLSLSKPHPFVMQFDLVLKNLQDLNQIAGEGEHFIKHTKDGAKLQVKESVPLVFYENGIFMFDGPFRPYDDMTTQRCMKDIMDGYFPSELQALYPDGVPFKVEDKRDIVFRDKRLEKLFPGQGHALSPEKNNQSINGDATEETPPRYHKYTETNSTNNIQLLDRFLSKLPVSVIKNGKIIDIREGLKETLTDNNAKNDIIVVDTEVVDSMKLRLASGLRSRPQSSSGTTTLRIKSETGDQTYILKMRYNETIADVRKYLQDIRKSLTQYDLKTSFPSETYTDNTKTLKDYGLVPNATLHIVVKK